MHQPDNDKYEHFFRDLPNADGARRFVEKLEQSDPKRIEGLRENEGLYSDVVTLAGFSPLLARTLLRNTNYLNWLSKERISTKVHSKEEVLESLARFSLTNSTLAPGLMLSRFRRRELIRIYLKDIRGLNTVSETTEDISNLADAIIEYALRLSIQEMDNRFGPPLFGNDDGKSERAEFAVIALGKLGSRELNYSSDIDLLFLYTKEGETNGNGTRGSVSNREYFVKVAEHLNKLIGSDSGEGAPYRVDMRLRPHGRVGTLAISVADASKYYLAEARLWEKQVLIRSRCSAGIEDVFSEFFDLVEEAVFSTELTPREALESVRKSKQQIDTEHGRKRDLDIKLSSGGIREIEFIAQAIQLAYGGEDNWLRKSHTLIALTRAADRGYIEDEELTILVEAYSFLRKLEHRLQMENGLQTHLVPDSIEKRLVIGQRMGFVFVADFESELTRHMDGVKEIFLRIFGDEAPLPHERNPDSIQLDRRKTEDRKVEAIVKSVRKSEAGKDFSRVPALKEFSRKAPVFARLLAANPAIVETLPSPNDDDIVGFDRSRMMTAVLEEESYPERLKIMRRVWAEEICSIAALEVFGKIGFVESIERQTSLAEASVETAYRVTSDRILSVTNENALRMVILCLGKLGAGGMDYGSDLDLVLIHDEEKVPPDSNESPAEFYARAAETLTRTISGMTRQGSLYKVDLRLRPDGRNGAITAGSHAFVRYLESRADVWEWLAYVKLRAVAGPKVLAADVETSARKALHSAALEHSPDALRLESYQMRGRLEEKKSSRRRSGEIDIKYGEGGLQDVYFAIRYLQLKHFVVDLPGQRGTLDSLRRLRESDAIGLENVMSFKLGYKFLRRLDHYLRLFSGRSSILRTGDRKLLDLLSESMNLSDSNELLSELTGHRMQIHSAFRSVFELND